MAMANASVPRETNPSCFGTIEDAARNVNRLGDRLFGLVDRLTGTPPPTVGEANRGDLKNVPSGLLAEAADHAVSINNNVNAMSAALDRLEKNLP